MRAALALTLALMLGASASSAWASDGAGEPPSASSSESLANEAREARRQGRLMSAAWALERALSFPSPSPLAREEGARAGWEGIEAPPMTTLASPWPWWLVGASAWLALLTAAWARRERRALVALALAPLVSLVALPSGEYPRPSLPEPIVGALDSALCPAQSLYWEDGRLVIEAECHGHPTRWQVTPKRPGAAFALESEHHQIGGGSKLLDRELAERLEVALLAAVQEAEGEGYRVPEAEPWAMARPAKWAGADPMERARLQASAGIIFAALFVLIGSLWSLVGQLLSEPRHRWIFIALFALAALALVLVEGRMRMMYSGYHLTQNLIEGSVPRYGPGAIWFYGPIQWILGGDHAWVQWMNRIYGLGCGLAVVALAQLWFDRGVALVTACLASGLPFFLFAYSCESIHVAPSLAILVAVALIAKPERDALVSAGLLLIAAALTRPEIAALVCVAPLWLWLISGRPGLTRGAWPLLLVAVAGALVVGLRMSEVLGLNDQLASQGAVSDSSQWLERGWYAMTLGGVFLNPAYLPSALLPLLVVAATHRLTRALALPTLAFGGLWLATAGVDYAFVSLIRLQLPVVLLWLPLMACAAVIVYRARFGKLTAFALGLWMLAGIGTSFSALHTWTVEDDEDRLWRDAVSAIDEGPGCLLSHIYGDETTGGKTPRFVPRYLLASERPEVSLHPLKTRDKVERACPGPVYVLRGSRCYAELRRPGEAPPPEGTDYCAAPLKGALLEPLFERDVPNQGIDSYPMYPEGESLRLGLYRVR